uniref:WSN domain-containing protein n=4 Tax=Caenorhabditis tropicalis TaxID=1561998 RepID=A0A1I7UJ39_9PELO
MTLHLLLLSSIQLFSFRLFLSNFRIYQDLKATEKEDTFSQKRRMNSSLNRKDIEDFWRRSNSICDQDPPSDPENLDVQVRRMSLADFTGLAPQQKLTDIEPPTWKSSSSSQSSLLNSFSTRRRSVLSTDVLDSPSRRLSPRIEEEMDVQTAIQRLRSIETKNLEMKETSSEDVAAEKKRANEAVHRIQVAARQLHQLPNYSESCPTVRTMLSEIVAASHSLSASIHQLKSSSLVYNAELLSNELPQVFTSLISFISKLDSPTMSANISTPSRKTSLISSSFSQLLANLNVLNRAISSSV